MFEIHKTLVISTSHMTVNDGLLLKDAEEYGLTVYEMGEYGWIIYVHREMIKISQINKFTGAFQVAIKLAQKLQCLWLRFDWDANTIEELRTFVW